MRRGTATRDERDTYRHPGKIEPAIEIEQSRFAQFAQQRIALAQELPQRVTRVDVVERHAERTAYLVDVRRAAQPHLQTVGEHEPVPGEFRGELGLLAAPVVDVQHAPPTFVVLFDEGEVRVSRSCRLEIGDLALHPRPAQLAGEYALHFVEVFRYRIREFAVGLVLCPAMVVNIVIVFIVVPDIVKIGSAHSSGPNLG